MRISDWSSDVCSSDLLLLATTVPGTAAADDSASYRERLPQDEVIYFVLPDRFANGDPANDRGGLSGDRLTTGYDPTDSGFYHGGDLKGLTDKLSYTARSEEHTSELQSLMRISYDVFCLNKQK